MAAADAGIVLNHLSNMKLKSGVAPVCDLRDAGVRLGLGCDNCSGSDVQSVFQAMKMFCLLSAVSEPEPGPPLAHEALRHATLGNARTAGLAGKLGAIKPGHKADLVLIDLNDTAYLPYNSAARQLVYTESRPRRGERDHRRPRGDDRSAKSRRSTRRRFAARSRASCAISSPITTRLWSRASARCRIMLDAHRKVWAADIGMNRFIGRTRT